MTKSLYQIALCLTLLTSINAHAHKRWFMLNEFNLSEPETVSVDFTASNNLFYADKAMPLESVTITSPNGENLELLNSFQGERRSGFEFELNQPGTYHIASSGKPIYFVSYEIEGEPEPIWKRGSLKHVKSIVPEEARNVKFAESHALIESYVSLNNFSDLSKKPNQKGLRLQFLSHPSDLYSDTHAEFTVLLDGKPTKGITVTVIGEGTRYRDSINESQLTSDEDGKLIVKWQQPGRYLLEMAYERPSEQEGLTTRYDTYFLTLEVQAP